MLEILSKQRIKTRRGKRRKPTTPAFISLMGAFSARLFQRNKNVFVMASGLLALIITAVVFSAVLQNTLSAGPNRVVGDSESADISGLALETAYNELGAGARGLTRDRDLEYIMQEGDSLYNIGRVYSIDPVELQDYNGISNPYRIRAGAKIIIPSKYNLKKFKEDQVKLKAMQKQLEPPPVALPPSLLPASAVIAAATKKDGQMITASFAVQTGLAEQDIYYQWDLGDGTISHNKTIDYTYLNPGTYNVSLTLKDKYGYELKTNTVSIEVSATEGSKVIQTLYLTIPAVGEIFALGGRVAQIEDFIGSQEKPIVFVEERDGHFFYRAQKAGYYYIIARGEEAVYRIYLFISPFPSVQNDRFDVDWYRTQHNTGPSNCGPATVSMALGWAKGEYVPISAIRGYMGWQGDGGTSFPQLLAALHWKGTKTEFITISSVDDLISIIDSGRIAIILYHSGMISWARGRPETDLIGRYYTDSTGHYVVIKGYTRDKKYFVVYDPLPTDWVSNSKRYGDGVSMIGRNRFYPVNEVFAALTLHKVLVIAR